MNTNPSFGPGDGYVGPMLGNEKKQEGEEQYPLPNADTRQANVVEMPKVGQVAHDEPRAADANAFGNGTTSNDSLQKPGWVDPY